MTVVKLKNWWKNERQREKRVKGNKDSQTDYLNLPSPEPLPGTSSADPSLNENQGVATFINL